MRLVAADGAPLAAASAPRAAPGALRRAWQAMGWRQWLRGAGGGFLFGLAQALHLSASVWAARPLPKLHLFLPIAAHWVPTMTAAGGLMAFGLAVLAQLPAARRRAMPQHLLLVVAVTAIVVLLVEPPAVRLSQLTHLALELPFKPYWMTRPFWSAMGFYWGAGIPAVLLLATMGTLLHLYGGQAQASARALSAAQLVLARVQQRVLAEQLAGAQATVDPAFLFAQLQRVQDHFASDPPHAQRLLDALIRYLRAALPAYGDCGCTLGQQAELVQAYVELESLAAGDRLRMRVEMRPSLATRPIAPQLLLPLVANAVQHGIGPGRAGEITLRVSEQQGGLLIAIDDDGRGRAAQIREGAGLAGVRQRLALLYGPSSRLRLTDRHPAGLSVQLDLATGDET
jgi:hypothetical protein